MDWMSRKRRYYMGAYAFEAQPPFRVTRVTPEPILVGSIDDPWWEGKPLVVFPCAALLSHGLNPDYFIWTVSLGVNDLASARIEIPHFRLLQLLSSEVTAIQPESGPSPEQVIYA
jgi:predicted GH43/DUF377 family glycosyl hydrolase